MVAFGLVMLRLGWFVVGGWMVQFEVSPVHLYQYNCTPVEREDSSTTRTMCCMHTVVDSIARSTSFCNAKSGYCTVCYSSLKLLLLVGVVYSPTV